MQLIKRVIQAAKERAQIKFLALTRLMVKDAETSITQLMADPKSGINNKVATGALVFLRHESASFLNRMESMFRESVERAVRTMYNDMRKGMTSNLSADSLSLVDDETVIKQMEVGNLVQRLRDECDENLGRLNIMIAQVHGDPDVHERENPFRPYLIARALYEVVRESAPDEETGNLLFAHLADSLARNLSEFYSAICDVFDASGIQARLLARPTHMKKHQRDHLARQLAEINANSQKGGGGVNILGGGLPVPDAALPALNQRVMPSLHRMQELLQRGDAADSERENAAIQPEFEDFVWKLFNRSQAEKWAEDKAVAEPEQSLLAPASPALLSELDQLQQLAADGKAIGDKIDPDANQLFAVGDKLASKNSSTGERIAIDVIAVLFEFILEDEQIPAALRLQIGRLQIPLLKAAMLSPDLLRDAGHPARKLLNRMGSASVGIDPASPIGAKLGAEIGRIVKIILKDFDKDVGIFTQCLQQLESFLADQLRRADAEAARSIEAVEEAEKASGMLVNTAASLRDILLPLNINSRVVEFILEIWARVLVRASLQDAKGGSSGNQVAPQYRDVLPELVWSAQEKPTPAERSALIRLLPSLVKRLRFGMLMIHLSEEECKEALDRLVEMHTQVLRPNQAVSGNKLPSLEELRQQFARLVISDDSASWTVTESAPIEADVVETLLASKGVEADLELDTPSTASKVSDQEWLAHIELGTCVQCWAADTHVMARVIWVSRQRSLFIFKIDDVPKPLVYSAASLVKALRDGAVRLVEYAPAFDRAVDSLMIGAEQVGRHE